MGREGLSKETQRGKRKPGSREEDNRETFRSFPDIKSRSGTKLGQTLDERISISSAQRRQYYSSVEDYETRKHRTLLRTDGGDVKIHRVISPNDPCREAFCESSLALRSRSVDLHEPLYNRS